MDYIAQRAIDGLCRLTVPVDARRRLGINAKDLLDVYIEDEAILIKKSEYIPRCTVCGKVKDLTELKHTSPKCYICSKCKEELKK